MTVAVRRIFLLLMGLAGMLMLAAPAFAQSPDSAVDAVVCDGPATSPGDTLTCSRSGCKPGSSVEGTTTFQSDDTVGSPEQTAITGESVVGPSGTGSVDFELPDDARGPVDVSMTCVAPDGSVRVIRADAVATVAPAGGGGDEGGGEDGAGLGGAGGYFQLGSLAGASLLLAGALLLVTSGRRRTI